MTNPAEKSKGIIRSIGDLIDSLSGNRTAREAATASAERSIKDSIAKKALEESLMRKSGKKVLRTAGNLGKVGVGYGISKLDKLFSNIAKKDPIADLAYRTARGAGAGAYAGGKMGYSALSGLFRTQNINTSNIDASFSPTASSDDIVVQLLREILKKVSPIPMMADDVSRLLRLEQLSYIREKDKMYDDLENQREASANMGNVANALENSNRMSNLTKAGLGLGAGSIIAGILSNLFSEKDSDKSKDGTAGGDKAVSPIGPREGITGTSSSSEAKAVQSISAGVDVLDVGLFGINLGLQGISSFANTLSKETIPEFAKGVAKRIQAGYKTSLNKLLLADINRQLKIENAGKKFLLNTAKFGAEEVTRIVDIAGDTFNKQANKFVNNVQKLQKSEKFLFEYADKASNFFARSSGKLASFARLIGTKVNPIFSGLDFALDAASGVTKRKEYGTTGTAAFVGGLLGGTIENKAANTVLNAIKFAGAAGVAGLVATAAGATAPVWLPLTAVAGGVGALLGLIGGKNISKAVDYTPGLKYVDKAVSGVSGFLGAEEPWKDYFDRQTNALKALALTENASLDPNAVSKKGAQGLMQIMPWWKSPERLPKMLGIKEFDPFDPKQSIEGAKAIFNEEFNRFDDFLKAVAAYNAGSPPVLEAEEKAMAAGRDASNYYNIEEFLPSETREYVQRYLRNFERLTGSSDVSKTGVYPFGTPISKISEKDMRAIPTPTPTVVYVDNSNHSTNSVGPQPMPLPAPTEINHTDAPTY